jgi:hypothetical protein
VGGAAQGHKLPAYEASKSLYGIARALLIATNYLDEGRVRRRDFRPAGFELNIVAQRPGSFETVFEIISNPDAMLYGSMLLGGGHFLLDFISSLTRRSVGGDAVESIQRLEQSEQLKVGDVEALVDAIEPAIREAHKSVGYGATKIYLQSDRSPLVTFDQTTKDYVNTSVFDDILKVKLFSIASFDANSGSGRAFDFEEGRTIPFQVERDADRATIDSILSSHASYTRRRRLGDNLASSVAFQYKTILTLDGRVKKLKVVKVRTTMEGLQIRHN